LIIWFIGLSGSGKTTIGKALHDKLKPVHPNLVFVDGDVFRDVMGNDLGHSQEDRQRNAHRFSHFCRWLDQQSIHLICCVLSNFPEWQIWNRENFRQYFEISLDVPMETLKKRDIKNLYQQAFDGKIDNVVGVDISYIPPENFDMLIDNSKELADMNSLVEDILKTLPEFE